jgi:tetratricopeptide (TPR) repeat protein
MILNSNIYKTVHIGVMTIKRKDWEKEGRITGSGESYLEGRLKSALNEPRIAGLEEAMSRYYSHHPPLWKKLSAVAATLLLVLSIPAVWFHIRSSGDRCIYNSYFAPGKQQQISGIYRGLDAENNTPFLLFSAGKLEKALPELREYLGKYPSDAQARLMMAICLMDGRKFDEAERQLNQILDSDKYYFMEDARWYLALIEVRKGEKAMAIAHLRPITGSKIYARQAASLMKKLEKK